MIHLLIYSVLVIVSIVSTLQPSEQMVKPPLCSLAKKANPFASQLAAALSSSTIRSASYFGAVYEAPCRNGIHHLSELQAAACIE